MPLIRLDNWLIFIPSSIGGTPAFISDALGNELKARAIQDSRENRTQSWHVIALPDSNMSNETTSHLYRGAEATERYPIATQLRAAQQRLQGMQRASGPQQHSQAIQRPMFPQERRLTDQKPTFVQLEPYSSHQAENSHHGFVDDQQPILAHNGTISDCGWEYSSVPQSQQLRFPPAVPGNLSGVGRSTMMFHQEQPYIHIPQQGSFQGLSLNSGTARGSYLSQGNNMTFDPTGEFLMESLPQAHRPVFDRSGSIVGEQADTSDGGIGGNLYHDERYMTRMYRDFGHSQPTPFQIPQQIQGRNIQLRDASQSLYTFVANKLDENKINQGDHDQQEDPEGDGLKDGDQDDDNQIGDYQEHVVAEEEEVQDEGIAMGNTSRKDVNNPNSPQGLPKQWPEIPPAEVLWARERSPYRFQDRTGMGYCDYCDRVGHEAYACLKWDPDHYDKPVCTACNNKEHSLDECPKFRAMPLGEKQSLLVTKGAGRPGVRSQYHAWTRYVVQDAAGLPLTRRFLQDFSKSPGSDVTDTWKDWDYDQGVPAQFRDSVAEVLAADDPALVDERFMDGNHGFGTNL